MGIATHLSYSCESNENDGHTKTHTFTVEPDTVREKEEKTIKQNNLWFVLNYQLVMAIQCIGEGGSDADTIIAFLDLPCAQTFRKQNFAKIKSEIGFIRICHSRSGIL